MFFKAKHENKVVTKVIYNIIGINRSGHKEILGFYDFEFEESHFWLGALSDPKAHSVEDILDYFH